MDPRPHAYPFPATHAIRARRLLLGIPLPVLAREAGLAPHLLEAVERGDYDPRSLHAVARQVLGRVLDLTL